MNIEAEADINDSDSTKEINVITTPDERSPPKQKDQPKKRKMSPELHRPNTSLLNSSQYSNPLMQGKLNNNNISTLKTNKQPITFPSNSIPKNLYDKHCQGP